MTAKTLITGGDPDERFPVPSKGFFGGAEFMVSPDLEEVGNDLIRLAPELEDIDTHPPKIVYVWREKAKKKQGKTSLGFSNKVSGLAKFFGKCDWVIEIGADICREIKITRFQIEALLFHELNHIEVVIDDKTGDVSWNVRAEEFYAFSSELRRYGAWFTDLERASTAFAQMPLFEPARSRRADTRESGTIATITALGRTVDLDDPDAAESLTRDVVGSLARSAGNGLRHIGTGA